MAGRLAIDFGTSNTVIANWDHIRQQGVAFPLLSYGRFLQIGDERVSVVPSLIHYQADGKILYGNEVLQRSLSNSQRTFQWMKRYIQLRSPATRQVDGKAISHFAAAEEFLKQIIQTAMNELRHKDDEEIAVTVPVEAFEHYESWIFDVVCQNGGKRIRLIDEPSAAALGYSARLFANQAYLVFDFGGGTLDVSIVRQEESALSVPGNEGRSRVLGKAGAELGGTLIDEWLFQDVLAINGCSDKDPEIEQMSRLLLSECESLKEKLSFHEKAELTVMNPITGSVISCNYTRQQLEDLLDKNDAFAKIDQTLRRALSAARERGFDDDDIKVVLMVGGCSQIPSVQNTLKRIFGRERVRVERPLDAVARGAAAFIAGERFHDYLQHDYAVRMVNSSTHSVEYKPLVKRGTSYPSEQPLARLTVKAVQNHQEKFGFLIYEMGSQTRTGSRPMEIFFTESGNARLTVINEQELDGRSMFCLNETQPFFLEVDSPAFKGEARFEVSFGIDGNRRLLISTKDLKTGQILHENFPIVKLS